MISDSAAQAIRTRLRTLVLPSVQKITPRGGFFFKTYSGLDIRKFSWHQFIVSQAFRIFVEAKGEPALEEKRKKPANECSTFV